MERYKIAEHNKDSDWAEEYSMLKGPNGFECCLTEPEDRVWYRDGDIAVQELNKLDKRIKELEEALFQHRWDMHYPSDRPCPTCRQSAKALRLKVPDHCARKELDEKSLKGK